MDLLQYISSIYNKLWLVPNVRDFKGAKGQLLQPQLMMS